MNTTRVPPSPLEHAQSDRARKGVLITTSTFSKGAREYVTKTERKIVLVDEEELAGLMMDHRGSAWPWLGRTPSTGPTSVT